MVCNSPASAEQYTPCYCEENIYLLAQRMQHRLLQEDASGTSMNRAVYVVFISSASKATPIWCQRSNSDTPDIPLMWDYHVILLCKYSHGKEGLLVSVYDYDTTLPFPADASSYINAAFRPQIQLRAEYAQYVWRCVS